jgi:hypothetical protein
VALSAPGGLSKNWIAVAVRSAGAAWGVGRLK